jgi:hypothetical protein
LIIGEVYLFEKEKNDYSNKVNLLKKYIIDFNEVYEEIYSEISENKTANSYLQYFVLLVCHHFFSQYIEDSARNEPNNASKNFFSLLKDSLVSNKKSYSSKSNSLLNRITLIEEILVRGFQLDSLAKILENDVLLKKMVERVLEKYNYSMKKFFTPILDNKSNSDYNRIFIDSSILSIFYENIVDSKVKENTGMFYTENIEVIFMCKVALAFYLTSNLKIEKELLIKTVFTPFEATKYLSTDQSKDIIGSLTNCYIIDPACGSGNFLVVMVSLLEHLITIIGNNPLNSYERLLILEKTFGIDINQEAILITRLRLFLWYFSQINSSVQKTPKSIQKEYFMHLEDTILNNYIVGDSLIVLKRPNLNNLSTHWKNILQKLPDKKEKFDIFIGNPPYIRASKIGTHLDTSISKSERKKYQKLIDSQQKALWGEEYNKSGKFDYYIYFLYLSRFMLEENGICVFITSNSWLEVDYGKNIQEFLLKHSKIHLICENQAKRSFAAEVNTSIIAFQSLGKKSGLSEREASIRFIAYKTDYRQLDSKNNFLKSLLQDHAYKTDYSVRTIKVSSLWNMALRKGKYDGLKWGSLYLRAPAVYFDIWEKNKQNFTVLSEIACIGSGILTGSNSFFYLQEKQIDEWDIESQFLKKAIKSPKELSKIIFVEKDANYYIFDVNPSNNDSIENTKAYNYIVEGEKRGYANRPSIKARKCWYQIRIPKPMPILWPDLRGDLHLCHWNSALIPFEHNFYGLNSKYEEINKCLLVYLNCSLNWFFIEIFGRTGLGSGAIRLVKKPDLQKFPVLREELFIRYKKDFLTIFRSLEGIEIDNIDNEFFYVTKDKLKMIEVRDYRKNIDNLVMKVILNLSDEQIQEIYEELLNLIKRRKIRVKRK